MLRARGRGGALQDGARRQREDGGFPPSAAGGPVAGPSRRQCQRQALPHRPQPQACRRARRGQRRREKKPNAFETIRHQIVVENQKQRKQHEQFVQSRRDKTDRMPRIGRRAAPIAAAFGQAAVPAGAGRQRGALRSGYGSAFGSVRGPTLGPAHGPLPLFVPE